MLGMAKIRVLEIATFYTMFQLEPVGQDRPYPGLRDDAVLAARRQRAEGRLPAKDRQEQFHVSADGDFSWEEVECLGACVNAPLIQIGADTYEDLTRRAAERRSSPTSPPAAR